MTDGDCKTCGGRGHTTRTSGFFTVTSQCPDCGRDRDWHMDVARDKHRRMAEALADEDAEPTPADWSGMWDEMRGAPHLGFERDALGTPVPEPPPWSMGPDPCHPDTDALVWTIRDDFQGTRDSSRMAVPMNPTELPKGTRSGTMAPEPNPGPPEKGDENA